MFLLYLWTVMLPSNYSCLFYNKVQKLHKNVIKNGSWLSAYEQVIMFFTPNQGSCIDWPSTKCCGSTVTIDGVAIHSHHDHYHKYSDGHSIENVDKDVPDERCPAQVPCAFIVSI